MRPASPPSPDTSAQSTRPDNLLPGWRGLQLYPPSLSARGGVGEALSARGDDLRVVLNSWFLNYLMVLNGVKL